MPAYVSEDEQLETIRVFFKTYKQHIIGVFAILLCIGGGFRYWQVHQTRQLTAASQVYELLMRAVSDDDHLKIHAYVLRLIKSYRHTVYAEMAQLLLAKSLVSDAQIVPAKAALEWVMTHAKTKAYRQIARLRLARLYMSEHNHDRALALLAVIDDKAYAPLVFELKGDIYTEQGLKQEALNMYDIAQVLGKKQGLNQHVLNIKLSQGV